MPPDIDGNDRTFRAPRIACPVDADSAKRPCASLWLHEANNTARLTGAGLQPIRGPCLVRLTLGHRPTC